MQVLSLHQAAQILVYCDPDKPLLQDLLKHSMEANNFLVNPEFGAQEGLQKSDWETFWRYTELVKPSAALKPEYVPVSSSKPTERLVSLH